MKSTFFKNGKFVEAIDSNDDIWVFGSDSIDEIDSTTPVKYVSRNVHGWGDGSEQVVELPIPDGHGGFDYKNVRAVVCEEHEAEGTEIEKALS